VWAQLITMRLKEGSEDELSGLMDALHAVEQPGSGLLHSFAMTDHDDPRQVKVLVVFESEEQARAREDDPRRQEALVPVRQKMAELFEGPPGFTDLTVVVEWSSGR
jgi:heme-degrading monooxygenase HmoA